MEIEYKNSNIVLGGTYKITNTLNGKVYYGSTKKFISRLSSHIRALNKKIHRNTHLQNAWNKDGPNAFLFEIIEIIQNKQERLCKEQVLLDLYWDNCQNCYNIEKVADANREGIPFSEEVKRKMSRVRKGKVTVTEETRNKLRIASTGRKHSQEAKEKVSKAKKGIKRTPEQCQRMSEACKGRRISDEVKKKISEAIKGRHHSEEAKKNMSTAQKNAWIQRKSCKSNF